jgi:hypothetical protein
MHLRRYAVELVGTSVTETSSVDVGEMHETPGAAGVSD